MTDKPKPKMVIDGVPWWDWLYTYRHDGAEYSFSICAPSRDDADARLRKIATSRFEGQADGSPLPLASASVGGWVLTARAKLRRLFGWN